MGTKSRESIISEFSLQVTILTKFSKVVIPKILTDSPQVTMGIGIRIASLSNVVMSHDLIT